MDSIFRGVCPVALGLMTDYRIGGSDINKDGAGNG